MPVAKYFTLTNANRYTYPNNPTSIDFSWFYYVLSHSHIFEWEPYYTIQVCLCDSMEEAVEKLNEHSWYKYSDSYLIVKVWVDETIIEQDSQSEYSRYQPEGHRTSNMTGRIKYRIAKDVTKQGQMFRNYNIEEVVIRNADRKMFVSKNWNYNAEYVAQMQSFDEEMKSDT